MAKDKWKEQHPGESVKNMMLPLIRLKVSRVCLRDSTVPLQLSSPSQSDRRKADCTKVETSEAKEMTNPIRFGNEFSNRVANPKDLLQYYRKKKVTEKSELIV